MNYQPSKDQLELLASISTPNTLPTRSSILASEETLLLWPFVKGSQSYKSQLRDFSSDLLAELKGLNPSEALSINRHPAQHLHCLMVLLHSLAHVASFPFKYKVVGISLNNNDYSPGRTYSSLHHGPMARIVRMMNAPELEQRFCRVRRGTFDRATSRGVRTRLWPSQKLMDLMTVAGLVWPTHPFKARHPAHLFPVGIRADDTSDLIEVFGPLSPLETVIPKANVRLKTSRIALHFPNHAAYQRYWSRNRGFKFHLSGNQLTRQFKYDLSSGGRVYGHWVQGVPEKLRQHLTINGLPVVEWDYKGMQVHLAYSSLGLVCDMEDPYRIPGFPDRYRDAFKAIFLRVVGSDATHSLDGIFRHGINMALGRFVGSQEIAMLTEAFWAAHEPLRQLCNTEAWRHLQLTESEIALTVMAALEDQGITCIPIFDGFVVQSRHSPELELAMKDAVKGMRSIPQPRKIEVKEADH